MRDRDPSSSSSEGSPLPPSSSIPFVTQLPMSNEPVNDFAVAAFQSPESIEKLINAFKVYDQEHTNRRLAAMFNASNGPGLRVVPFRDLSQYKRTPQRQSIGLLPTTSEADEDEVQEQIDQARLEELAGSDVDTIVQDDPLSTPLEQTETEVETEQTQAEALKNAKAAKRAKQKEKKKKGKAGMEPTGVPSTATSDSIQLERPTAAEMSSLAASLPPPEPATPDQVLISEGVRAVSTIEESTLEQLLPAKVIEYVGDADIQATSPLPEVRIELASKDHHSVTEEDRYFDAESSESDNPLTPTPIPMGSRAEAVRPESVRTEMTLVLGEDDVDELRPNDDTGLAPVFSPPTATLPILADKHDEESINTAATPPPMSSDSVVINKRLTSPHPSTHATLNFLSPDTSSPAAGLSDSRSDSSPESPATPGTSVLLASEKLQFGLFQHHEYPKQPTIAHALPRRPPLQGPISVARSPLALAPPITPSTLQTPTTRSLEPTRQNTPESQLSGLSHEVATEAKSFGHVETTEHVPAPMAFDKQDPASVHYQPLNYAYTLYSSNTKAKAAATPTVTAPLHGNIGLGAAPSADTYSNELVPIFTASTLGDFFGSWKALRRKLAHVYGRPIEPEGSLQIPAGTEGLGLFLCPGVRTIHFFRQGIKPMWEDPMCDKGGKIMYAGRADEADHTFFQVVLAVIAGCFDVDVPAPETTDNAVVGVVLSKRERHSRVEVWLGGSRPPPRDWVVRVEQFLKTDIPGEWYGYKSFH